MRQPGVAATYEQLLREVWGAGRARNVDFLRTLVRRLRRKIEDDLSDPKYLLTENHVGYYFAVPDAE
jgi:two-component system KDP operon response regulator KdpE